MITLIRHTNHLTIYLKYISVCFGLDKFKRFKVTNYAFQIKFINESELIYKVLFQILAGNYGLHFSISWRKK